MLAKGYFGKVAQAKVAQAKAAHAKVAQTKVAQVESSFNPTAWTYFVTHGGPSRGVSACHFFGAFFVLQKCNFNSLATIVVF